MSNSDRILQKAKLKVTPKRIAILDILGNEPNYVNPEDVWQKMKQKFSRIGLPTVYRNLENLSIRGVITKIIHPNRQLYYYLCTNNRHHHHFICLSCKRVEELEFCPAKEMEQIVRHKLHGKTVSHMIQINGVCRECLRKRVKEELR
jgi:Fe2+ or Zn2+ uptake regulation protein